MTRSRIVVGCTVGCNAWNHHAGCDCGYGGDTGGGSRSSSGAAFQAQRSVVQSGLDWRLDRRPCYASYTNPNATCPVCRDSVYFYQSPHGGRAFFDSLGPPWLKHPCTDTYLRGGGTDRIFSPELRNPSATFPVGDPFGWRPLIWKEITRVNGEDRVEVENFAIRMPGRYLYLPRGLIIGRPVFWRRVRGKPSMVEVSTVKMTADGAIRELCRTVPSWYRSDAQRQAHREGQKASAETLNSLGWSVSFAWRTPDKSRWTEHAGVDFPKAQAYFVAAAKRGLWAAYNNLGVMARDGLGRSTDAQQAFRYFQRAAEPEQKTPLKHLAACYRDGVGVQQDTERARKLFSEIPWCFPKDTSDPPHAA